jgi:hypothetical protein
VEYQFDWPRLGLLQHAGAAVWIRGRLAANEVHDRHFFGGDYTLK